MKNKLFRYSGLLFLLLSVSWLVQAHEFWMQPDRYRYSKGESSSISFKVGENFQGDPWQFEKRRIKTFKVMRGGKTEELKQRVADGKGENMNISFADEGTVLMAMESDTAFIAFGGKEFVEYLKEDGLDDVLDARTKKGMLEDSAKELYSRHSKLLVQVGRQTDDTFKSIAGFPLEIVPLENPYTLKVGDRIHFKILYLGKPLFGCKVKIFNRYNNRTTIQNLFAQQDGTVETTISNTGTWMVGVVKMIPRKGSSADYRSYWSSLSFGT